MFFFSIFKHVKMSKFFFIDNDIYFFFTFLKHSKDNFAIEINKN